ncbi:MAG: hypothetical protein H7839_10510 [Magnetococcus sp. YQC-5]
MMSQFAQEILNHAKPKWATMVRQNGRKEGKAEMLLKQIGHTFGQTPDWATEKVNTASQERLNAWSENFVFAHSVDDVFADRH